MLNGKKRKMEKEIRIKEEYSQVCRIYLRRHKPHNVFRHWGPVHIKN